MRITNPKQRRTTRRQRQLRSPPLRFSPTAWAKLLYLRDYGPTEVGGFGITSANDLLLVEEVALVRQTTLWGSVTFDDESVADLFDQQVDEGRRPEQVGRIWVHTHPGDPARPSETDEETFARVFGPSDWAVMFILACGGQSYARLQFNTGPKASMRIPVEVDFTPPFDWTDEDAWEAEYLTNVVQERREQPRRADRDDDDWLFGFTLTAEDEEAAHVDG